MPTQVVHVNFARKLERERDEARGQRDEWKAKYIQQNKDLGYELRDPNGTIWSECKRLQSELTAATEQRDEARESLASREVVIAQQNVITDLILERDGAREVLQEIEAARWHTACELRRLATQALGSKK